jgi:hypothetical protein
MNFMMVEGTPGTILDDAVHVAILGRGRDIAGMGLSDESASRAVHGAEFWSAHNLSELGGSFISSGYKTPGDPHGSPWSPQPDAANAEWFTGIPEADNMDRLVGNLNPLLQHEYGAQVDASRRRIERASVDTVTNLAQMEAQDLFGKGDTRPVVLVGQTQHLERTLQYIAPKVLRRDYVGLVVPEVPGRIDEDSLLAACVSRAVVFGVSKKRHSAEQILSITDRRIRAIWSGILAVRTVTSRNEQPYHTVSNE